MTCPHAGDGAGCARSLCVSMARAAGMAPMIQRAQIRYLSTSWKTILCMGKRRMVSGLVRAKAQAAQAGMRRCRHSMVHFLRKCTMRKNCKREAVEALPLPARDYCPHRLGAPARPFASLRVTGLGQFG